MKIVPGSGPLDAAVCIVGEAPGAEEERLGVPFIGLAGQKLDEWLQVGGLTRADVRIENVVGVRPPSNKLERLGVATVQEWAESLWSRIEVLPQLTCVVAVGNLALNALRYGAAGIKCRKQKGQEIVTFRDGITRWRGSELGVRRDGRVVKVIPTIHPAAVFRQPSWEKRCRIDWQRIGREKGSARVIQPAFRHRIRPTLAAVEEFVQGLHDDPPEGLTYDIETYKSILCIGFARSDQPLESFTIPTTLAYWRDGKTMSQVWGLIAHALRSPSEKVTQNGFYDNYWLERVCHIRPTKWVWDLMGMHHTIDPLEDHDLSFMSSIFAPHYCFWKDEAKDEDSIRKYANDFDALLTYNGIDVCRQIELWGVLRERLAC